jgi:hypothetical protein
VLTRALRAQVPAYQQVVALTTDQSGAPQFDAIIQSADKIVFSKHSQLVPAQHLVAQSELMKPDDDAIRETTERTRAALEKKLTGRANVTPLATAEAAAATGTVAPTFLRYTPASMNGAPTQTRVVKMVSAAVDPLEPPKFRHRKTIKAEGDPPVPVMHSPPRHVTPEDQLAWKVPPCISNWKNTKGYTIPLDKRLAADGRGLQEVTINDNFAKFAESLYIAEASSREEVAKRAAIQRKLAVNEKEQQEDALRRLAAEARMKVPMAMGVTVVYVCVCVLTCMYSVLDWLMKSQRALLLAAAAAAAAVAVPLPTTIEATTTTIDVEVLLRARTTIPRRRSAIAFAPSDDASVSDKCVCCVVLRARR